MTDWRQRHIVHPGFHGQVVRQVVRHNQPQPVIQSHTPAQPYIQSRGQPYIQGLTAPRPVARPQAPVSIPQQQAVRSIAATVRNQPPQPSQPQVMRSIGATVRNQAQQAPHMRAPFGHAPQGGTRMQSGGGNHQRRG